MSEGYRLQVNAIMDYIDDHLDDSLDLETLSKVSGFSKYHFHRIFKAVTGETLHDYVKRVRLDKAGRRIEARPDLSLTEIAFSLGFGSSASFSREVGSRYGLAPSRIRARLGSGASDRSRPMPPFRGIESFESFPVLYLRVDTGYDTRLISAAFLSLYEYAAARGFAERSTRSVGMGHDDPEYTVSDRCRYDACIEIPPSFVPEPDCPFNRAVILGGRYAVFDFSGRAEDFAGAWDAVFRQWALGSEARLDDRPHFELYLPSDRYAEGLYEAKLLLPVAIENR